MKAKKFKPRNGAPFPKKDAQKIGEELENIKAKKNLTPNNVNWKRQKNKKSILHKYFEWDNSEAAEKYRLQQAKNIINHVVEVIVIKGNVIEERAYFNVIAKNNERSYVPLTEVIKVPSYKKHYLERCKLH